MALITEFVKTVIPVNWKSTPSGWTSGNCPMCVINGQGRPDTKGRGGIRFDDDKFQYNCFNCGYKTGWSPGKRITGRLKRLFQQFGVDESEVQRLQLELLKEEDYGYCESCGAEIGLKRLEVRPTATLCVDCKTVDEIKEHRTTT